MHEDHSPFRSLLDRLLKLGEREWVEFKVNNTNPDEIGKRLSALANGARLHGRECGYLVYGVQDAPIAVVGTEFSPRTAKKGNEDLEMWLSRMLDPRIDFRIVEFEYDGYAIVMFEIPAAEDRPVRFQNEPYIRVNSITKPLREYPDKERKLWHTPARQVFEKGEAAGQLSADEVIQRLDVQSYFELIEQPLPRTQTAILDKLIHQKLVTARTGSYGITNLGAILFARRLSDFEGLERKAVRVIVYDGPSKRSKTLREQPGVKGYAAGFKGLIEWINSQLPANELIGQALRQEVRLYPELAIRELVANALVHQDFALTGTGPLVEIYSDRIEITNPGLPIIDPLRFIDENQSRNEQLASLMRLAHICEERGSGIDKAVGEVELYQLPPLEFLPTEKHTKVVLFAPRPLEKMDKSERVQAAYQHCCLLYVMRQKMTNQTLRTRLNIADEAYSTATRILNDALAAKLIKYDEPEGASRKHARYIPFWA
ncbi:ATP-binding protein [Hymenobacter sp. APR13]|uniref:ATP-binding protein n=1 Tax=Hymenobacter sp. APR13 TaxID=1356852 RepID=UPI0004E03538|nr:RNA-binding domain-containing protein [Hymenobacter sp. APR13]AII50850.1 hypothetical protein N008_02495 [Hymenobacter sp. APR13]